MASFSPARAISASARNELATIGFVGSAHFASHFMMLALAPVLPLLRHDFDVGFTELGWLLSAFFATSGFGQILAGVLVDRIGPHRLLLGGMVLQAAAVLSMAFAPNFPLLMALAVLAGLGNTVYHPSDLSILSRRVGPGRIGRAFAMHSIAGQIGFAASPLIVGAIASAWGWRPGLVLASAVGLAVAILLLLNRSFLAADADAEHHPERPVQKGPPVPFLTLLRTPVVGLAFAFFFLTAVSGSAILNFSISAFNVGYGATLATATVVVALAQVGSIGGILLGGTLVDRLRRPPQLLAAAALAAGIACFALAAITALPFPVVAALVIGASACLGFTLPARDVIVRQAAPQQSLGKVFGLVYSGLDAGSLVGPPLFGYLLDHGEAELVFVAAALTALLAMPTLFMLSGRKHPETAPAAAE